MPAMQVKGQRVLEDAKNALVGAVPFLLDELNHFSTLHSLHSSLINQRPEKRNVF